MGRKVKTGEGEKKRSREAKNRGIGVSAPDSLLAVKPGAVKLVRPDQSKDWTTHARTGVDSDAHSEVSVVNGARSGPATAEELSRNSEVEIVVEMMRQLKIDEEVGVGWPADLVVQACWVADAAGKLARAAGDYEYVGCSLTDVRRAAIRTMAACMKVLKGIGVKD